ncbi:MAG: septum formation protein Maf [Elusimicrobia bacterium]|nr:septum formation protein Maf [Elusimicrobiota bacterium]
MILILASASPQRRKLLRKAGFRFSIYPPNVQETDADTIHYKQARKLVQNLAVKKARAIAEKFKNKNCVILGADTLVVCNKKILGKPKNTAHARCMLESLSNRWQTVMTGLCLIKNPESKMKTAYAKTKILFHEIDSKTISRHAQKNLDKSGSYAIQKMNDRLIKHIKGDLDNVIGLPIRTLKQVLKKMKINPNNFTGKL